MRLSDQPLGLYTDYYELSMAQGYFYSGKKNSQVVFDYFFRTNPYKSGFTVFAGLYDFLESLGIFTFSDSDIDWLKGQGMKEEFLEYLKNFSFQGSVFSVKEGEIIFPNEPVLRIEGNIIECQLIESMLLNILNFESLIATKSFRVWMASGGRAFSDFGLRRAQGFGALQGSKAAVFGGASSTSNVLAGKLFGIPVSGTQAHSWIQCFDSELEAFRVYAENNPENTTLLVDTYDTLKSGIPHAITVAKEMESRGQRLKAIRLDSGDLAYFSKKARAQLDAAGLPYVKIVASNQLNELVIQSLIKEQNAPIDLFGVGTELITGKPDAAHDGVYKLAAIDNEPKMKISENIEKVTLPGKKRLYRIFDDEGNFYRDAIILSNEDSNNLQTIYNPIHPNKFTDIRNLHSEELLDKVFENGNILAESNSPQEIFAFLKKRADKLPDEHKRFVSPHIYKVGISQELLDLQSRLLGSFKKKF